MLAGTVCVTVLGLAAAATAQTAAPQPPAHLLVGSEIVAAATLAPTGVTVRRASNGEVRWQNGDVYVVGDTNLDAATGERLRTEPHRLCLESPTGTLRWAVARTSCDMFLGCAAHRRLLLRERVIVPRQLWGLVAIDRATGAIAWQRDDVPNDLVVAHGDLVFALGSCNRGGPALAVLAAANGALASRNELPEWPRNVRPGAHGVAVALEKTVRVYDLHGPLLFERPLADVVAGAQGWFALVPGRKEQVLECWSRTGDVLWQVTIRRPPLRSDTCMLFGLADGDVAVLAHDNSTNGGFVVRRHALSDGAMLWETPVEHGETIGTWSGTVVRECGRELTVTRQAGACGFAARIDPRDGTVLAEFDSTRR